MEETKKITEYDRIRKCLLRTYGAFISEYVRSFSVRESKWALKSLESSIMLLVSEIEIFYGSSYRRLREGFQRMKKRLEAQELGRLRAEEEKRRIRQEEILERIRRIQKDWEEFYSQYQELDREAKEIGLKLPSFSFEGDEL